MDSMEKMTITFPCSCEIVAAVVSVSKTVIVKNVDKLCVTHLKAWMKILPREGIYTDFSIGADRDFNEWARKFIILDDAERLLEELKK